MLKSKIYFQLKFSLKKIKKFQKVVKSQLFLKSDAFILESENHNNKSSILQR